MSDLLLTHGYFLEEDPKELQIRKPYVPLGILYICSHLRSQGFDVEVFDTTFSSLEALAARLRSGEPRVLGVYANLMTRKRVVRILEIAKEAGWKTVVGGPEPGAYIAEYLTAGADVVVIGEGERTMEELLPALEDGSESALGQVKGIAFRDRLGQVRLTPERAQLANLDAQPWPARDAVDIGRYMRTWRDAHGRSSLSFITARGCPYRCQWCSHQVFGMTHRRRKPAAVVDEVEWLLSTYRPDMMWIADDVFTIHPGWLKEYAGEMRHRGLKVPFECISRADRVNDEVADLLSELGCYRLWIGSESGSQRILDSMQRGVTVGQVRSAIGRCKQRGIETGMFLMWGYQGEEVQDIEATIEHVKRSKPDIFFTTVSYPIKGTPYYNKVSGSLVEIRPWKESSDRELVVRNRRSPEFYERADRLLRDEVAFERLNGDETRGPEGEALKSRIKVLRDALYADAEARI
jgi:anaerobic magnesium-protoporphyrin IX monomethyl ester cyclase